MKKFFKSLKFKVFGSIFGVVTLALGSVASFADYTVQPIPSPKAIDFSSVGELWSFGASMLQDVIAIISNQPILVALVFALPLVGLGIGLFKRLVF